MATDARREFEFYVPACGNSCGGYPSVQDKVLVIAPVFQTAFGGVGLEGLRKARTRPSRTKSLADAIFTRNSQNGRHWSFHSMPIRIVALYRSLSSCGSILTLQTLT
jgi:hypothetical protein